MSSSPYDRALVLASYVRTMKDHYLAVRCSCSAKRVIFLGRMADNPKVANYTLAHVAMTLKCRGCFDGPDEVHLTASIHGLWKPAGSASLGWTMPLVERKGGGSKRLRFIDGDRRVIDVLPLHEVDRETP